MCKALYRFHRTCQSTRILSIIDIISIIGENPISDKIAEKNDSIYRYNMLQLIRIIREYLYFLNISGNIHTDRFTQEICILSDISGNTHIPWNVDSFARRIHDLNIVKFCADIVMDVYACAVKILLNAWKKNKWTHNYHLHCIIYSLSWIYL